jgi:hypothetical protein
MSRIPTINSKESKKRIARATKRKMVALISSLTAIDALLILRVAQDFWPMWLMESQAKITGLLSLFIIFLICLAPIIIEFNSDPRPLSGPGKDPRHGGVL